MKTLKFDHNSWHFRFIKKYTTASNYQLDNICSYMRWFGLAAVVLTLILLAVTFFSFLLTQVLVGIGFSLYYGMIIFSEPAMATLFAIAFFSVMGGLIFGISWAFKQRENYKEAHRNDPDGFIAEAYKSWKDKYCARIEIVYPEVVTEDGPAEY